VSRGSGGAWCESMAENRSLLHHRLQRDDGCVGWEREQAVLPPSPPSKPHEGKPRTARQLLVTRRPHSKRSPCLARGEMALGKADFTRSEASPTPKVTQAYQGEPELRDVTPAFRSLPHPRAGAGPKGFPVPLSAFPPRPPDAHSPLDLQA